MSDDLIWVCFEPINYPVTRILHGRSDPNGDKDVYVPYVPADSIEQLKRERDEARHLQSCACNYDTPTDVCMGHHALFERLYAAERGKLEARLAKAVEALHIIDALDLKNSVSGCIPDPLLWLVNHMGSKARAVLAELEGGK